MSAQLSLLDQPPPRNDDLTPWAEIYLRQLKLPRDLRDDPRDLAALSTRELFALKPADHPVEVIRQWVAETLAPRPDIDECVEQ